MPQACTHTTLRALHSHGNDTGSRASHHSRDSIRIQRRQHCELPGVAILRGAKPLREGHIPQQLWP